MVRAAVVGGGPANPSPALSFAKNGLDTPADIREAFATLVDEG